MPTPPFSVLGIDHVVLRCARLELTLAFYRDVLGCTLERVVEHIGLHQLRAGTALIDLLPVGSPLAGDETPVPAQGNMHHVCLRIARPSWPAVLTHLERCGASPSPPERRYGAGGYGLSAYLTDPEGNTVELKADGG